MIIEETFYRPTEISRERRTLPAEVYNLSRVLLKRASHGCLFVPLRNLQVLAVLDDAEFIFVDREGRRNIELAWQSFTPQVRASLEESVSYEAVYYTLAAAEIMRRAQMEFLNALRDLEQKQVYVGPARILKLDGIIR
ncbi:MAG: hypothetical protein OEY53_01955 [Gammaproteobacteria bacterium]|nr:hypothetical protein [Gammaproteobacteria bacterium]